jgi:hypothetical protein
MTEMVDPERLLEPLLGLGAAVQDQPGVVHEHVEVVEAVEHLGRERPDRPEAGEIERHDVDGLVPAPLGDLLPSRPAALLVAGRDDHLCPARGERHGRFLPDPGVPTCDPDDFAGHLVHDRQRYP